MIKNNFCPCCSNSSAKKLYRECCGVFIAGEKIPSTPEKLMRSRYSAYVRGDIAYIQKTMTGEPLENFDPEETRKFIESIKWQELNILKAFPDSKNPENLENPENSNKAYVNFSAIYKSAGKRYEIRETSEFLKQEGQWFYSGEVHQGCGDSCGHEH